MELLVDDFGGDFGFHLSFVVLFVVLLLSILIIVFNGNNPRKSRASHIFFVVFTRSSVESASTGETFERAQGSGEEISGENGTTFNLGCPTLTLEEWRKKGRETSLYTTTVALETNTTRRIRIRTRMSQPQPEEVMHQVQAELANAYAQEFFTTVREKCFKLCVSKPSSSLSSYERKCLEQCTERYVDATRMISQVVLKQYSNGGGSGGM